MLKSVLIGVALLSLLLAVGIFATRPTSIPAAQASYTQSCCESFVLGQSADTNCCEPTTQNVPTVPGCCR